jgi:hypothetical protein
MTMKNTTPLLLIIVLAALVGCQELEEKSTSEKTIDLLTAGIWKVDSLVAQIKSESPGLSIINSDTTFLNYGTFAFQKPVNEGGPGYGTGYLIHTYTEASATHIDTLAWVPYNFDFPASEIDHLTIFYPDPSVLVRQIVINDIENMFLYLKKEPNIVRFEGGISFAPGSGSTIIRHYKRYHLSK